MRSLDWLRREATGRQELPWTAEGRQSSDAAEQDALQAQEEYEYHIALALSQSANDERLALAQQEADTLASVTKRSLAPSLSGRSTGQAEALSFRLWDSDWCVK